MSAHPVWCRGEHGPTQPHESLPVMLAGPAVQPVAPGRSARLRLLLHQAADGVGPAGVVVEVVDMAAPLRRPVELLELSLPQARAFATVVRQMVTLAD